MGELLALIAWIVVLAVVVTVLMRSVRVIRQQQVAVVERLGKFRRTLEPGPHLLVPVVDTVRYTMDMREVVVPFPPQAVITEDNLMVSIDSVIYFQVVDPVRAAYEAQNYIQAIEQLTMTTLRNIIGGLDLEQTLTSREEINQKLRAVLDEATGKWGIKVNRVELRSIEPPATIRDAMEKGARAERDKRAAILMAEGQRQSQILSASGDRESAILRAQGERESAVLRAQADRQASMLRAEGEAQAITTTFNAIHAGKPTQSLLAYQYLRMLPNLARGESNKMWIIPSELNDALKGLGSLAGSAKGIPGEATAGDFETPEVVDVFAEIEAQKKVDEASSAASVQQAIAEAEALEGKRAARLASPGKGNALTGGPIPPAPVAQAEPQLEPGEDQAR
ncbi:SPFH domain-containing protein [Propionicimonas sp.]|uniref:SPFH domain-containing protein n=1 Tax=Propionicimonas sp. TaxID=1955623 RepID=UPI00179BA94D|nr:SPFH domain-containing protein [Propionicimonas sp.]MBU3977580.1 SPFH/Band 7/PHB domain protein [Actinomycetota bacterium]MBA3021505.1 SPFH/Band 7/PHB domain protein [Propionicimonas sp.]MBU3987054.1 SPFH/Band 7/PHB domain protein [Actinomycetota bacterium]MBU4008875.1 SPFH/Band 7/PHB domain protein [Actinomycetota bacterium]MBU4065975.1 SPFH/Band 7/PHB domain protein [Actinomycetota bacterium]